MSEIGKLYKTDGTVSEVKPRSGDKFSLSELQEFVGGSIETVPFSKPLAFCNEEGLLIDLPHNFKATEVFAWPGMTMPLRGNVIQVLKRKASHDHQD